MMRHGNRKGIYEDVKNYSPNSEVEEENPKNHKLQHRGPKLKLQLQLQLRGLRGDFEDEINEDVDS